MARKICVVTGSRSDYGLLYWLLRAVVNERDLDLQLVVTGMHLAGEFGNTYKTIEEDGFVPAEKLEMLLCGDSPSAVTKSIGLATIGFADIFQRLEPDILVLLGDRFESIAAAQAALVANIPIGHIHGGERTEGVIDEAIRHSITKMAHLHFTSNEIYRRRVIQLGENPKRVFNVGALGIEGIKKLKLLTRAELSERLGFEFGETNFLVTYHPLTLKRRESTSGVVALLSALDEFPQAKIIMTYPNYDTYGREIIQAIVTFANDRPGRVLLTPSLGQLSYLSALSIVDLVVGNSSSGLIEAPSFYIPTINIGTRQNGRIQGPTVIQCDEGQASIAEGIRKGLSSKFRLGIKGAKNPYGDGQTSQLIVDILKQSELNHLLVKSFYDIEFQL